VEEVVSFLAHVGHVEFDGLGGPGHDFLEREVRGQLQQRERLEEQAAGHANII